MNRRQPITTTATAILQEALIQFPGAQRQRAQSLGVPHTTLVRWESGAIPAALADLEQMAKALGVQIVVQVNRRPG